MRLALCIFKYFPYGGLQRDFKRIAEQCLACGHEVTVFAMEWQGAKIDGIATTKKPVIMIPKRGLTNHSQAKHYAKQVKHYIEQLPEQAKFDCVIGFNRMPGLDVYFAGDVCFAEHAKQRSWFYQLQPRCRSYLDSEHAVFATTSSTRILFLTPQQKQAYQAHYQTPDDRFYQLPPGIARDRIAPNDKQAFSISVRTELGLALDSPILLMVGSDYHRKGLDRALLALAALPENVRSSTHLVHIGRDNPAPYLRQIQQLGLAAQVHLLGPREDVARFMFAADIFLHPARSEAAGMVLIEALTAHLPILVTEVCGYAYHIEAAQAGLIIKSPFQQTDMNAKLQTMLMDKARMQQWCDNAKHYAHNTDLYSLAEKAVAFIEARG